MDYQSSRRPCRADLDGAFRNGPRRLGFEMTDAVFQMAYETVRRSYAPDAWVALTPRQITDAIYREIRRIDAEKALEAARPEPKPGRRAR